MLSFVHVIFFFNSYLGMFLIYLFYHNIAVVRMYQPFKNAFYAQI